MAQAQLEWESLPDGLRDITAFQPIIATVLLARFPSVEGYQHQPIGTTDHRVRRGLFNGWDVRVWRQENVTIDVSPGSRFNSALPILAGLIALTGLIALGGWDYFLGALGRRFMVFERIGLLFIASWTALFLVSWGLLWLLTSPIVAAIRRESPDQETLEEILRALPGQAVIVKPQN